LNAAGALGFVVLSINPVGGVLISIPLAVFTLKWSPWPAAALGAPLAYVQVLVVDLFWDGLHRWGFFRRQLERARSPLAERLLNSHGAFWPTLLIAPVIGPWLVMSLMRYARVPQKHVGPPILLGLFLWCFLIAAACRFAPALVRR
jgi:hypothetical protein